MTNCFSVRGALEVELRVCELRLNDCNDESERVKLEKERQYLRGQLGLTNTDDEIIEVL